jgi:hypothetical protein
MSEERMLSMQNIESELSYAYLHAIASRAGIICEYAGRHSDAAGVDAVLRVKGRLAPDSTLTQFTVDVQLKATKRVPVEQAARYSHSLEVKNYNELRSTDAGAPQLLVVLFLPDDAETWLTHGEEGLVSRRCAYWLSLHGAPGTEQDSKTVYVPRANMLSVNRLLELMTRYSKREVVGYEP